MKIAKICKEKARAVNKGNRKYVTFVSAVSNTMNLWSLETSDMKSHSYS